VLNFNLSKSLKKCSKILIFLMFSQAFTQIQASDGLVNPITTKDDAEDIKAEENFNKWYEDLAPNCIEDELQRIYEKHFKEKEPFKKLLSDLIERIIEPSIPKDYVEDFKSTLGALVLDHIQIYVQDKIQTYVQDKIKNYFQNEVRESFNSDQADIQNEI